MRSAIRAVIIPLSVDIKSMIIYRLACLYEPFNPVVVDLFPTRLLEAAQDPVAGVLEFYQQLKEYMDQGMLGMLSTFVDDNLIINEEDVFRKAGLEISNALEEISRVFVDDPDEIENYNMAGYITDGIVLLHVNGVEDADFL